MKLKPKYSKKNKEDIELEFKNFLKLLPKDEEAYIKRHRRPNKQRLEGYMNMLKSSWGNNGYTTGNGRSSVVYATEHRIPNKKHHITVE